MATTQTTPTQAKAFQYLDANIDRFREDYELNATAAGEDLILNLGGYDDDEDLAYEHSMNWVLSREKNL